MREYIRNIHQREPHEKKRFALLSSLAVTLSIFMIWSIVRIDGKSPVVAEAETDNGPKVTDIGPLKSMSIGVATAFKSIIGDTKDKLSELEVVQYEE